MPGLQGSPTGLLVVRIWLENGVGNGTQTGLRARITHLLDVDSREENVRVVSSVPEIRREVEAWLDAFMALHGNARS
jgi:hypothetical protein